MTDPRMPGVYTELGAGVRPDTRQMAYEVVAAARAAGYPLFYVWGNGPTGDHKLGLAVDFMVYGDGTIARPGPERPAVGRWVADYVWANRVRLGVRYEIFSRRIRSQTGPAPRGSWLAYRGSDPHTNHVHVSRLPGARRYIPPPAPPRPAVLPPLWLSEFLEARSDISRPRDVKAHPLTVQTAERALADFGFGKVADPDGHYGSDTVANVRAFQVKVSGKADGQLTWSQWQQLAAGAPGHKPRFIAQRGTLPTTKGKP